MLDTLLKAIASLSPGLIAQSGGVDSRLLSHLAAKSGERFELVHIQGPHVPAAESQAARVWCEDLGLRGHFITVDPLLVPEVRANTPQRCYHCKHRLFTEAWKVARERGLENVLDGSNASDLGTHRPGLVALRELGISSPLAECGVDKPMVRRLSKELGLSGWDTPARPCLLTRFAYDVQPDREALRRIEDVESALAGLGFLEFRLRAPLPETFVLHLADTERPLWGAKQAEASQAMIRVLGYGPEPVWDEQVSGTYDRERKLDGEDVTKKIEH